MLHHLAFARVERREKLEVCRLNAIEKGGRVCSSCSSGLEGLESKDQVGGSEELFIGTDVTKLPDERASYYKVAVVIIAVARFRAAEL